MTSSRAAPSEGTGASARAPEPVVVPDLVAAMELPPFDPLNLRAAELRRAGHRVISLGQALPFFPPPSSAIEAARRAIDLPAVHRYSTDPGLQSLRTLLAERLGADLGERLSADDFVITAGANHAFTLAITTLVAPGDEVVLPAPYFTNHQMAVRARGAVPVEAPVEDRDRYTITWADIEPRITARTRAVVLCTPSNPTGAMLEKTEGERLVRELAQRRIVLISDETYAWFVHEGEPWSAASAPDWRANVAVIGSFSKAFGMMGWRAGYLLADRSICAQAVKVQDAMIICAPVISQMAVEGAVRDDWRYAHRYKEDFGDRRRRMAAGLGRIPGLRWMPTPGGLFAFVRVEGCRDSAALARDLLERAHVVTIPGAAFGASGEGCLRLSYGYASPDEIDEAMERLARF